VKFRAVANGNIVEDVPQALVAAGIYEPVEEDAPEEVAPDPAPEPVRESVLVVPEQPLETVAHADPQPAARRQRNRSQRKRGR
jgi:hypothetical protein